jgi:DNA mismatch repair ATPase MutS
MSAIENKTALDLIESLKSPRYEDEDAMLVFSPAVQTLAIKLYEEDKHLAQLFACIAELDVYNALANKIIESKHHHNKFCLATFSEDAKPSVKTEGFWNILVDNPVLNDIDQDHHVILTGPNAGGKTT